MGNAIKLNGNTYSIRGKLGTGGFSEVYLVEGRLCPNAHLPSDRTEHDENNDSLYALKVMQCDDDDQLRRALMEVQVHRRLKHPNVVPLVESEIRMKVTRHHSAVQNALSKTKEVLLLFPVYSMGSLQQLLNKAEHMPLFDEPACLHIFLGIARGVREIHALGLAHRDIKPGNVLLSDTYAPVVMDLGSTAPLYVSINNHRDATVLVEEAAQFSSAPYRAPELWDDSFRGTVSGKADVWSLGCILYALVFGPFGPFESPHDGVQRLAILNGTVKFPSHVSSDGGVSVAYVALIQRLLQVNVDNRPTLDDVITATEKVY
ncbi:NAK/MPSK protein kinase, variant [Aphanomyces invadans]|uniref:non-specific serine/threonine protein kinase n=1 Tax=Aphanomyces invadans TaxID=157072 RepID=A0A024UFZ8_9STRA|nr:NAK/MPSK protein kinase, variant [Aphanomyces invadans]ETW05204.1 NAK/MPSK protein kinase, variant [Aphanomyces invadans]|eukprot:XP_008866641.1 NAK/MPSK protein kinase, variant [Aphanomyces invadans]